MRSSLIPSFLYLAFCFSTALSFSVTVGSPPTQCGSLNVTWIGGQPPFNIMLIPAFDVPKNLSIPPNAFQNNRGSYEASPIPFTQGTKFLLTMSDATGFGTGGTSDLITVEAPVGSASCNTSQTPLSFTFSLPSSLQQCSPYIFEWDSQAISPITITGLIPGGNSFSLHPPSTGTSFTWTANVAAGTTIIFTLTDAKGNSGGSSDTQTVALSNDASCLNAGSPTSTLSSAPSSTSAANSSTPTPTQISTGISTGTIIGAAVGAVLAVAAIVTLAVFYLKRQRQGRSPYGLAPTLNSRRPNSVELDPSADNILHTPIYPFPYQTDSVSRLAPPIVPGSPSTPVSRSETSAAAPSAHISGLPYAYQQHSRTNSNTDSFVAFGDVGGPPVSSGPSVSSSGLRKAAMARTGYRPARFIVHTDAEDHVPEDEVVVVELPPQYSERRTDAEERPVSSAAGPSSTNLPYLSGLHVDEPPQPNSHPPPE